MYFNGTSSKGIANQYLIGLDNEGNIREVLQEQQNKLIWFVFLHKFNH